MATKIQVRRDTAANWTSADPTLSDGEMGYETDTGYMKVGDGSTAWSSLAYFTPGDVSDDNTTYTISTAQNASDADVTLTGSDASTDSVKLVAGANITLTVAGDNITIDATDTGLLDITGESIGDLSDVDTSAVTNGNILTYNSGTGTWTAGAPAVTALNDLSDVDEPSASPGDILHYVAGTGWTGTTSLTSSFSTPGIRLRGTLEKEYNTFGTLTGNDGDTITHTGNLGNGPNFYHSDTDHNFVANFEDCFLNAGTFGKFTIMVNNEIEGRSSICTNILINGFAPNLQWVNGEAPTKGTPGEVDIIEVTVLNTATNLLSNLLEPQVNADVFVWAHHLTQEVKLDGDLTGSVFGDDSTLLVDGVNNTIPAANLSGTLPALDGSSLTGVVASSAAWADITGTPTTIAGYGITDGLTNLVEDTSPQLGGNLDLNTNNITGTGNITITAGDVTLQNGTLGLTLGDFTMTDGNLTVGGDIIIESPNHDFYIRNTGISGTGQTFGKIAATTGTTEYNQIVFKTAADSWTENGEVNWITRVQGTDRTIFEIKGSTLGSSGMTVNPDQNALIDFNVLGSTDALLLYVDASTNKVGVGKLPTQGILDIDGAAYATSFTGQLIATGTAPVSASATGTAGEIRYDANYIYICTATDTWKRAAIATW